MKLQRGPQEDRELLLFEMCCKLAAAARDSAICFFIAFLIWRMS